MGITISSIEYKDINDITQYSNNAKLHPDEQIEQIAESISEFSFIDPVAVDEQGVLLEGHGRVLAARKLRLQQVPVIEIKGLTEAQKKGYRIAHNKLSSVTSFDSDKLLVELEALSEEDFDLSLTGFNTDELDEMLGLTTPNSTDESSSESEEELPDESEIEKRVRRGQVWVVGNHRVMCGDCKVAADVEKLLGSEPVNVVMTSPPYASQRKYDEESGFKPIPPSEYVQWFEAVQANIRAYLAKDGSFFLNIKEHMEEGERHIYVLELLLTLRKQWRWAHIDTFAWTHQGFPISITSRFKNQWEPIYHLSHTHRIKPINFESVGLQSSASFLRNIKDYQRGYKVPEAVSTCSDPINSGKIRKNLDFTRPGNVLKINLGAVGEEYRIQSAAYPIALPEFFIKAFSDEGDRIYDPFAGSGTTICAAHRHGRVGLAMEISETYSDLILTRLERETGEVAKLELA